MTVLNRQNIKEHFFTLRLTANELAALKITAARKNCKVSDLFARKIRSISKAAAADLDQIEATQSGDYKKAVANYVERIKKDFLKVDYSEKLAALESKKVLS